MFNLYENIKTLCAEKHLTVSAMCEAAGMSKSTMSNLNNGRSDSISRRTASKIAAVLGCSVDDVLHGRNEKAAAPEGSGINPRYYELSAEDRATVDALIERLTKGGQ